VGDLAISTRRLFMFDVNPDRTDIGDYASDEIVAVADADLDALIPGSPVRPSGGRDIDREGRGISDARTLNQRPDQGTPGQTLQTPCLALIAFRVMAVVDCRERFDKRSRFRLPQIAMAIKKHEADQLRETRAA
jgi:hypothetical protein